MVRLRNAGRWERPDVWGQERDAPGQLAFDRLLARHGRPASCCPARRAPRPPGDHCKSDIAKLVVTEWHCFLLRPGDVADCSLGCVAVATGLQIRKLLRSFDIGSDRLAGDCSLRPFIGACHCHLYYCKLLS